MRQEIKETVAIKGYSPIYSAIDKSIENLKRLDYDRDEIKETMVEIFGGDNGPIDRYISNHI